MPDASNPDSSRDSTSPSSDRDLHRQQWETLCDVLGTANPDEVLARVQTLKRHAERGDDPVPDKEGLVTISEVEEVFRELNSKIARLRKRNATLADRLEREEDTDDNLGTLHKQTEALLDTLGATTISDAHDRVEALNERIEELHQGQERLAQAGLSDAEEALNKLNAVREERDRLRDERDQLRDTLDQQAEPPADDAEAPSTDLDPDLLDAAVVIRDQIGIASPNQAKALTRVVETLFDRIQERAQAYGLDVAERPDSVVGLLRRMSMHLNNLPPATALPDDAAAALGVSTADEARTLADQARRLAAPHEDALRNAGTDPDTADALTLLQALADHAPSTAPPDETPDEALPPEVGEVLGIETVADARELEGLIDDMSAQIERLREEHELLDEAGLSPEGALTMIENMEAQLADLYHTDDSQNGQASAPSPDASSALSPALVDRIDALLTTPAPAADDLSTTVERLVERLETLSEKYAPLAEAGLSAEDALALIDEMEAQLNALYKEEDIEEMETGGDAARRLSAIEDVLGISTREEAEELSEIAHQMEVQLTELYEEKQKLQDLGLASFEDAADMIKNMESQLNDLYEDKEALRDLEHDNTDEQSTFQQLEALYAERQQLQQALGVSAAEDVIEMVETLSSQLDDVYTGRDADVDPEERRDAQLWAPESAPSTEEETAPDAPDAPSSEVDSVTLTSMEHQLESLYREKEALLKQGYGSASEAVNQLQTQRRQIDVLQRENHAYKQRFHRLQSELGTDRVPRIVEIVRTLESEADTSLDALELSAPPSSPSGPDDYNVHIEAIAAFVEPDTLDRLDEMAPEELETLDVGVVQLDEDGTVTALNKHALQLPSLESDIDPSTLVGKNFFLDLAPSTNNNLFFGRFQKGQHRGEMDARFPYTFTPPNAEPASFAVHLYRTANSTATWLLFQPA